MPVTASYSAALKKLTLLGDTLANSIVVTRDASGNLLINGGSVPVTGGPATIANTDLIEASGLDLDDIITLDETGGVLPPAILSGGNGSDTLTGGSGGDQLFGGADNDTLRGGPGADTLSGEDGNDRMIWNPGDGTDVMEGGNSSDIAEVNGGSGAEVFTITANGTRVRFDRVDPAPFMLDIGTTESLVLNAGGGDDSISTTGNLAALIALTLNAGAGNDTVLGSNGVDIILGDVGNDFIDGQQGNDFAFLGDGDDIFQWDPGDGSDTIEGQAGTDRVVLNGSAGAEIINLLANGARTRLTRDLGTVVLDPDDVELFTINAGGGNDNIVLNDLTGTDTSAVTVNLSGTIGGSTGDTLVDFVSVNGTAAANTIDVTGAGTALSVSGLPWFVSVNQVESTDGLQVFGGGNNDVISASTLSSGIVSLLLDGGAGDDTINGSAAADTLLGGDGNDLVDGNQGLDTAFLGPGHDIFNWDPGDASDVVEGQAGTDELRFNGSNASENINIQPNGGRSVFLRDVAAITMDMDDIETIRYRALGGADNVVIANMAGTDVTQVIVDLAAAGGGGDTQVDRVTVQATDVADTIAVNASFVVSGLAATTDIDNPEATDRLIISGLGGDDVIDVTAIPAGQIIFELLGGLGADVFLGSGGVDLITGGDGNDTALMGAGDDVFVWNPGDDNDILEGQAGTDRMDFNGNASTEGISISPNGGRVTFFRDVASVTMDLNDVEQIVFAAGAGTDAIVVNDLTGTDVTSITLNLSGTIGGTASDAQVDQITLFGGAAGETIDLLGITGTVSVLGLAAFTSINQLDFSDLVSINGGGGNDTINASFLSSGIALFTLNGGLGDDNIQGTAGSDTLLGGDGNDIVEGNQGLDTAFLGAGNDRFNWNPGDASDVIEGDAGTDELFFNGSNANEVVSIVPNGARASLQRDVAAINMDINDVEKLTFNAIGGTDTITIGNLAGTDLTQVFVNLAGNGGGPDSLVDRVTVQATDVADTITISAALVVSGLAATTDVDNPDSSDRLVISGNGGDDTINASAVAAGVIVFELLGGLGNDILTGSAGVDFIVGGGGTDNANGGAGNDTITSSGEGVYLGGSGDDLLIAGSTAVNEDLDGGIGSDTLDTRHFNGTYNINMVTGVTNFASESFVNFENVITGNGTDTITGTAGANEISTTGGIDSVNAGAGNDIVSGGAAGDTLNGGTDLDIVDYRASSAGVTVNLTTNGASGGDATGDVISNFEGIYGSAHVDLLTGNGSGNLLDGMGGNDTLNGGAGADALIGGTGDDVLFVDDGSDFVGEAAGEGNDRVVATVNYALAAGAEVETLETGSFAGTGAINLTGSDTANTILGNNGVNSLLGQGGDDTLHGFAGADYLVGGGGLDNLYGGTGDDRYYIGSADGDRVWEVAGEGYDTVSTEVDYTLPDTADVERLEAGTLGATTPLSLGGSNLDNLILGNAGNNQLRGFAGADTLHGFAGNDVLIGDDGNDTMYGGAGNDVYFVDAAGDQVFEFAGEGSDRVATAVSYALASGASIETLETTDLTGTGALNLTGSIANQFIIGNNGNNMLQGGGGNDHMIGAGGNDTFVGNSSAGLLEGGLGNDVYFVIDGSDLIIETSGGGNDRAAVNTSYTLGASAEVETLETFSLAGTSAFNLTGNAFAQLIVGNNGANTIDGKGGADVLVGAGGADRFAFTSALGGSNVDSIEGFVAGQDKIALDDAVFANGLAPGSLDPNRFVIGSAAADADDRIIYNSTNGALFYDADGNGAGAAVQFATLAGSPALTASDFLVI